MIICHICHTAANKHCICAKLQKGQFFKSDKAEHKCSSINPHADADIFKCSRQVQKFVPAVKNKVVYGPVKYECIGETKAGSKAHTHYEMFFFGLFGEQTNNTGCHNSEHKQSTDCAFKHGNYKTHRNTAKHKKAFFAVAHIIETEILLRNHISKQQSCTQCQCGTALTIDVAEIMEFSAIGKGEKHNKWNKTTKQIAVTEFFCCLIQTCNQNNCNRHIPVKTKAFVCRLSACKTKHTCSSIVQVMVVECSASKAHILQWEPKVNTCCVTCRPYHILMYIKVFQYIGSCIRQQHTDDKCCTEPDKGKIRNPTVFTEDKIGFNIALVFIKVIYTKSQRQNNKSSRKTDCIKNNVIDI